MYDPLNHDELHKITVYSAERYFPSEILNFWKLLKF